MSTIALNSNIYHSTSGYLEILNNFLASANFANSKGQSFKDETVEAIFSEMVEQETIMPEIQLLRSIFEKYYRGKGKNPKNQLSNILKGLRQAELDDQTLASIKSLVDLLKFHCAQSYARMKGLKK